MTLEPFKLAHLLEIDVHEAQRDVLEYLKPDYAAKLVASNSMALRIDGRLVLCGGLVDLYENTTAAHAWTLLAKDTRPHFARIHGVVRRFLEISGKRVIVATTNVAEPLGCRWLRSLGFRFDHIEPLYDPAGHDHAVYVRMQ
jgi:hypothetical protein